MPREMKESGIEWIGKIPIDWDLRRLQYSLNEIVEKNNPIQTTNVLSLVKDKGIMPYEEKGNQGNKAKEDPSEYKIAYPNTLVVNSMNILIGSVGISNYFGCVSPVYYVFKETDKSDLRYVNYIFQTREFQKELRKYAKGILEIRLRVSSQDIFKRDIPFPDKTEQQKIANFLDEKVGEIDKVIAKTKDSIEEYHNLEKAIIQEAVTKGLDSNCSLVDSGVKYIGLIPENWDVKRVKYIASSILKGNGITKDEVIKNGNIQCIRYGEIYTKYKTKILETISRTNYEQISSPKQIEKGDILCAATGELVEEIGKNVVYMGDDKCLAGGDIIIVKHNQNPEYLNYALNSIGSQEQKSLGKTKLKVIHISASEIGDIKVALPNLIEQQEIVDYLNKKCKEIELLIENKSKIISDLEKYKKSLIYEYVTGKREVR